MKLKIMKRSIVVLAAAFATMSTSAMAENMPPNEPMVSKSVQLTDAELDGITAGSVFLLVAISNPGNAHKDPNLTSSHFHCVNCALVEGIEPTGGLVVVWKPGTSPADTPTAQAHVFQPIGKLRKQ
jgi:hypothetical protein